MYSGARGEVAELHTPHRIFLGLEMLLVWTVRAQKYAVFLAPVAQVIRSPFTRYELQLPY